MSQGSIYAIRNCSTPPRVLFLHGFPESGQKWRRYLDKFADVGVSAVAFDLPGFGRSDGMPIGRHDVLTVAERICTEWTYYSKDPMYLVGHDWGGIIGWYIAAMLGHRLAGFTAIGAPHPKVFADLLVSSKEQQQASRYIEIFRSQTGADFCRKHDFKHLKFGLFDAESVLSPKEAKDLVRGWSQPGRIETMLDYYRIFFGDLAHWGNQLGQILSPTQVIWGQRDHALTIENLDGISAYVPNLQVHSIQDAGHWLDRSHFHIVNNLIKDHSESCLTWKS